MKATRRGFIGSVVAGVAALWARPAAAFKRTRETVNVGYYDTQRTCAQCRKTGVQRMDVLPRHWETGEMVPTVIGGARTTESPRFHPLTVSYTDTKSDVLVGTVAYLCDDCWNANRKAEWRKYPVKLQGAADSPLAGLPLR